MHADHSTFLSYPIVLSLLCLATVLSGPSRAADLERGSRVLFLGDSITEAGAQPGGYVALVKEAIARARPELEIEVIGEGVSGNRVPDLLARLDADVLTRKPQVVVVYIGINDVWHSQQGKGTPKEEFAQGLEKLVQKVQNSGARVLLCTPSVIGERNDGKNPLDGMLDSYCEMVRDVAVRSQVQLIDLRQAFLEHLKQENTSQAESKVLTTDGVHLNSKGNRLVAARMLDALGLTMPVLGPLRHVVLFKFKEQASAQDVEGVVQAFQSLPRKIDLIRAFECGTDVSVENRAQGYTHCFLVSFDDESDRDRYLKHPAHDAFVQVALPHVDQVLVFDFRSE